MNSYNNQKKEEKGIFRKYGAIITTIIICALALVTLLYPVLLPVIAILVLIPYGLYHIIKVKDWTKGGIAAWAVGTLAVAALAVYILGFFYYVLRFNTGYYANNDKVYYYEGLVWYGYQDDGQWAKEEDQDGLNDSMKRDYFKGMEYNEELGASDFSETDIYKINHLKESDVKGDNATGMLGDVNLTEIDGIKTENN